MTEDQLEESEAFVCAPLRPQEFSRRELYGLIRVLHAATCRVDLRRTKERPGRFKLASELPRFLPPEASRFHRSGSGHLRGGTVDAISS